MLHTVDLWHNILWPRYKGAVFSAVHKLNRDLTINFIHIASTTGQRSNISTVDLSYHNYPFTLIFNENLDNVGYFRRLWGIIIKTLKSDAELQVLCNYERLETWIQFLVLRMQRKHVAVFCDSTIYDKSQTLFKSLFKRLFFSSVDGVFCYGSRSRDYVCHYGASISTIFYPCQAVALPHAYTARNAFSLRTQLAPNPLKPRYLYVGRLSPEKNLPILFQAYTEVLKIYPDAELKIIGSGPLKDAYISFLKDLGLNPSSVLLGSKTGDDLFNEYAKATCLILPSISEPWGLVVNEALHYGCPAIVSDKCGCVPELIIEGQTGFTFHVSDKSDLINKMLVAPGHFSDISSTAKSCIHLMENYTPDKAAETILHGCKTILYQALN